jgi:YHS domain-containing protein
MNTLLRSGFIFLAAFALPAAHAVSPVNTTLFGVAIKGYDPVAYFEAGKPMKGDSAFAHEWSGATWRFASAANRDAFKAAPERYAPQYGGYCAWAVAQGYTAGIDPSAWKIVAGKLYLNYSPDVQKKWAGDEPGNIAKADQHWPKLLKK